MAHCSSSVSECLVGVCVNEVLCRVSDIIQEIECTIGHLQKETLPFKAVKHHKKVCSCWLLHGWWVGRIATNETESHGFDLIQNNDTDILMLEIECKLWFLAAHSNQRRRHRNKVDIDFAGLHSFPKWWFN